jgi:hypothetical protein
LFLKMILSSKLFLDIILISSTIVKIEIFGNVRQI